MAAVIALKVELALATEQFRSSGLLPSMAGATFCSE